ncbi:MAG: PIN domain-containing protein [Bacteroidota bacterium]
MTIVVDANILFSAVITPNGKIAKILSYPFLNVKRVSCHYIAVELHRHRLKIAQISKKPEEAVIDDIQHYLKFISIYDELLIESKYLKEAKRLTEGVDLYDMDYVALTLQTGGVLWTGDKKLTEHLKSMNFDMFTNTADLYELLRIG